MRSIASFLKKRLNIVILALKESGSLFRGVGQKLMEAKILLLDLKPSNFIVPLSILTYDTFVAALSFIISIFIILGNDFFEYSHWYILKNLCVFLCTSLSVFLWMQIHKTLWRYFSLEDCIPIALAVLLATLLYLPMMVLLSEQEALPKSVPFLNFLIFISFLSLSRYIYRTLYEHRSLQKKRFFSEQLMPVLLVGTGHSTELFIREIMHSPALSFEPVGILSPHHRERGRRIHTVQILGNPLNAEEIITTIRSLPKRPQQIIITENDLEQSFLDAILKLSSRTGLPVMQMIAQFSMMRNTKTREGETMSLYATRA